MPAGIEVPKKKVSTTQGGPLRVVQITDMHLYADTRSCLLRINTQSTFEQVISRLRARHWPADLVLATGDLVHDGSEAGYRRLYRQLQALGVPAYCIPGNHDEGRALARFLNDGTVRTQPCAQHGDWNFVFVDSTVEGSDGGHVSDVALERLKACLGAHPRKPALVCLHHQPVLVGSEWLDTMAVDNPQAFWRVVDAAPQVKGVIWGHVHQDFQAKRGHKRLLASPSTCVQFAPRSKEFAVDQLAPGYRWLELHPDGRIEAGVERLPDFVGFADAAAGGY
jgi:Icc protein